MRNNAKYERVFSTSIDINVWVPIAKLHMKTDQYLTELKETIPGNLFRLNKNFRQIIIFITISRLIGTFAFNEKALLEFNIEQYTRDEVATSIQDLSEIDPKCFSRTKKPTMSFYDSVFVFVAEKYSIDSIQAIQAKNKLFWSESTLSSAFGFSEKITEQVYNALPVQPWPVNIHKKVAQELNLPEKTVSDAISYLIFTHKLHYQVYGFVFDEEDCVIAEGEHSGHSVEQALAKKKTFQALYDQKFGF